MAPSNDNEALNPGSDSYLTLAAAGMAEIRVQKSRFLAEAAPVDSLPAVRQVVAELGRRYHDCRHVCFAWRGGLGRELQETRSDGGEPSGTAGSPILLAIQQAELTDCVVVVARYFGGVKLGTGGLARAYGEAAAAALARAPRRTVLLGHEFAIRFPYSLQKTLDHLLAQHGGKSVQAEYGEQVQWRIWLPVSTWQDFAVAVKEATAGEVQIKAPA
ncbi:MAG: YigZ family protein [bacterium]